MDAMESSILKNKTILIVDDYKINTELVSFSVVDAGAVPLIAHNGKECINIVENTDIDIILMDYHMPEMDGVEATKRIRSGPRGSEIIIIGISCSEDSGERDLCLNAGMNEVVDKLMLNCDKLIEITRPYLKVLNDITVSDTNIKGTTLESMENKNDDVDFEVMNYEKTLIEFDEDRDLLETLLQDFNKNIHDQMEIMKKALDIKDYECIQRESHGIKGGAANLNALLLADAAKSLETACKKSPEYEKISGQLDKLAYNVELFGNYVKKKEFL